MNQILELLNDRITQHSNNGKAEAVAALVEFRETALAKSALLENAGDRIDQLTAENTRCIHKIEGLTIKAQGFDKLAAMLYRMEDDAVDLRGVMSVQNAAIVSMQLENDELKREANNRPNAKLEEFTKAAMQGILASPFMPGESIECASITVARATLAELAKEGAE